MYIGIDVGKDEYHVTTWSEAPPHRWQTHVISTRPDAPRNWREELLSLIPSAPTRIAIESTGYHYSAPLFSLFSALSNVTTYEVHNPVTQSVRRAHIQQSKTDMSDSRALAYIARHAENVKGVHAHTTSSRHLRLLVNERASITRQNTRALNRVEQLAYSIAPEFAHFKNSLLGLILNDVQLQPAAIREYTARTDIHHTRRHTLQKLLNTLPAVLYVEPMTAHAIDRAAQTIRHNEKQLNEIDEALQAWLEQHEEVRRRVDIITSINGVGVWQALAFLVPCNLDPASVTKHEFKKMLGVSPNETQSGQHKGSMKTTAYAAAKAAIHLATIAHLRNQESPVTRYYNAYKQRMMNEARRPKLMTAKRKLAQVIWGVCRNMTPFNQSIDLDPTEE